MAKLRSELEKSEMLRQTLEYELTILRTEHGKQTIKTNQLNQHLQQQNGLFLFFFSKFNTEHLLNRKNQRTTNWIKISQWRKTTTNQRKSIFAFSKKSKKIFVYLIKGKKNGRIIDVTRSRKVCFFPTFFSNLFYFFFLRRIETLNEQIEQMQSNKKTTYFLFV